MDTIFSACSTLAALGWLLLILLPRWRATQALAGVAIPLVMAVVYLVLIVRYMPGTSGGFGSLTDVAALFSDPGLLLAGWVHYLAFDLFIGSWEVRDATRLKLPHLLVIPCLLLTFMLGPVGLLAYFVLRLVRTGATRLVPS
jgi:hypothetical protein